MNEGNNTKPAAGPKLHFIMERNATATDYSTFRCAGAIGCGERLTRDVVQEHAAKQHHTYDMKIDTSVQADG